MFSPDGRLVGEALQEEIRNGLNGGETSSLPGGKYVAGGLSENEIADMFRKRPELLEVLADREPGEVQLRAPKDM